MAHQKEFLLEGSYFLESGEEICYQFIVKGNSVLEACDKFYDSFSILEAVITDENALDVTELSDIPTIVKKRHKPELEVIL